PFVAQAISVQDCCPASPCCIATSRPRLAGMARSGSVLLACALAAAALACLGLQSSSFVGASRARGLRSSAPSVERAGYGGAPGGKPFWAQWEKGDYYLKPPPGTLQGFEYGRNQLADGRTAGDEKKTSSGGSDISIVVLLTVFFFASVYANDSGFFNP
ncbi:unnamed protein product, partial [Prorocentrum cordatum]